MNNEVYFSLNDCDLSYGKKKIFEKVSFSLHENDKIALIGKNGVGKSTLLKIIAGNLALDSGELWLSKRIKVGYLNQSLTDKNDLKIYDALLNLIKSKEQEYFIKQVCEELKIDKTQSINKLSGGMHRKFNLACILITNPDLLLLDEPTNHLDIESIIWLETFLKSFSGAVVIVSHDKMFLNNITNRTIDISLGRIYDFNKPYSKYLLLREEIKAQQISAQKNQNKHIQHTEKLIEKFRAKASKASMAQSLIKKLNKIDRIEIDPEENKKMKFGFHISQQPGKIIFKAQDISKYFGEKKVLSEVNFEIERGEKIAFVGQNGQGKSTLAKIIIGELESEGHLKLGHNVELGYFAQDQSSYLEGNNSVIEEAENTSSPENRTKVRDLLGAFLFSGEDVDKKIHVLSGGERNRLALCKLLLQPFNVLIMDEPTNHLDILSKNILKEALKKFEGTLILVSHDRDFLQGLCEKVIAFKDHKVKPFLGDLNSYLEDQKLSSIKDLEKKSKNSNSQNGNETKKSFIEHKKNREIIKKVKKIENQIAQLEKEIKDIDFDLEVDYERTIREPNFFDIYQTKKNKLKDLIDEWEAIQIK